jgi:hypothetical protein
MTAETFTNDEQAYFDTRGGEASAPQPNAAPPREEAAPVPHDDLRGAPKAADTPDGRTVPLAALQEERERRKDLQRQIEAVNRRAEERFSQIAQKLAAPPQSGSAAPREMPDPEKDAVGAIRMTAEEVKVLSDFKRQLETQAAQSQMVQAVMGQASQLEAEFERATPDYRAAGDFLRGSRAQELTALGLDPVRVQQVIAAESVQLAHAALQRGRNPAEVVYALAKTRGYAAPARPAAAERDADAAKLARIAKGQETGTSLGAASGAAPGKTGIEALLAMSDGEFAQALDRMSPQQMRQHFGS